MRVTPLVSLWCVYGVATWWVPPLDASCGAMLVTAAETNAEHRGVSASSSTGNASEKPTSRVIVAFRDVPVSIPVRTSCKTGFRTHARVHEGTGYRIIVADVRLGFPALSSQDLLSLMTQEILGRADEAFSAHGVLVTAPERIPTGERRGYGSPAIYESQVTAEHPGYYTIVYALVRPFNVQDNPKFALIRAHLD